MGLLFTLVVTCRLVLNQLMLAPLKHAQIRAGQEAPPWQQVQSRACRDVLQWHNNIAIFACQLKHTTHHPHSFAVLYPCCCLSIFQKIVYQSIKKQVCLHEKTLPKALSTNPTIKVGARSMTKMQQQQRRLLEEGRRPTMLTKDRSPNATICK